MKGLWGATYFSGLFALFEKGSSGRFVLVGSQVAKALVGKETSM